MVNDNEIDLSTALEELPPESGFDHKSLNKKHNHSHSYSKHPHSPKSPKSPKSPRSLHTRTQSPSSRPQSPQLNPPHQRNAQQESKNYRPLKKPPPIQTANSSQTLSRTLSASNVLYRMPKGGPKSPLSSNGSGGGPGPKSPLTNGSTIKNTSNGSPINTAAPTATNTSNQSQNRQHNHPRTPDLSSMKSLDDLVHRPYEVSVKSSNSATEDNTTNDTASAKSGNSPSSTTTTPEDQRFVVTYKQQDNSSHNYGRSSSRYYERMGARPWVPSLASKRSSSVHVPHIITNNSSNTPLVSPPLTPDVQNRPFPKARTPSFPSISEERPSLSKLAQQFRLEQEQERLEKEQRKMQHFSTTAATPATATAVTDSATLPTGNLQANTRAGSSVGGGSVVAGSGGGKYKDEMEADCSPGFLDEGAVPPLAAYAHVPKIFGNEPPQISGHCCTLVNDKLYIFGGKTTGGYSNTLHVFNCTTHTLSTPELHGDVMPPCHEPSATLVDHLIYYFGGGNDSGCSNDVYALNTRTFKFHKVETSGRQPAKRRGHTAVIHNKMLYIFGGQGGDDDTYYNDVWKLDVNPATLRFQWSEVISLEKDTMHWPAPRTHHTAHFTEKGTVPEVANSDSMLIFGGNNDNTVFDDIWLFEYSSQRWVYYGSTTVYSDKNALARESCEISTPSKGYSGVYDGEENDQGQDRVASVPRSPDTPPPSVNTSRSMHSSWLMGKYLLTVGGYDGQGLCSSLNVLLLDKKTWIVRPVYGLQTVGPCYHAGVIYDSRYYVVGGFDSNQILTGLKIIEMPMLAFVK